MTGKPEASVGHASSPDKPAQDAGKRLPPLVSVIIPFFKVEPYIDQCLASVANQTHRNLEVILVDDASPDESRAVAERYAATDHRFRLITHANNAGLGPARNSGVKACSGDFIFFLDSDDYLASADAIEKLVEAAEIYRSDIVIGASAKLVNETRHQDFDHLSDRNRANREPLPISGQEAFEASCQVNTKNYAPLRAWGSLIARACYERANVDYPPVEHEDMGQTPFLYLAADRVLYFRKIVLTYRIRTGSLSQKAWTHEQVERHWDLWNLFKSRLDHFGVEKFRPAAACWFAGHMLWRTETNGLEQNAREKAFDLVTEFLTHAARFENARKFDGLLTYVRTRFTDDLGDRERFVQFAKAVSARRLLTYYTQDV